MLSLPTWHCVARLKNLNSGRRNRGVCKYGVVIIIYADMVLLHMSQALICYAKLMHTQQYDKRNA